MEFANTFEKGGLIITRDSLLSLDFNQDRVNYSGEQLDLFFSLVFLFLLYGNKFLRKNYLSICVYYTYFNF